MQYLTEKYWNKSAGDDENRNDNGSKILLLLITIGFGIEVVKNVDCVELRAGAGFLFTVLAIYIIKSLTKN